MMMNICIIPFLMVFRDLIVAGYILCRIKRLVLVSVFMINKMSMDQFEFQETYLRYIEVYIRL